jgi:murein DD-endopeptidase MepM/ murein hydrolase activator NlpD
MTAEHKIALATAGFLLALGACSVLSVTNRAPVADGARQLIVPIAGIATSDLVDSWGAARDGGRRHEGVDIMADEGTPVRAAASGKILKLHRSERGGITVYQVDASGWVVFCYAHLNAYAEGLEEGMTVAQGQVIAEVGQTGNATTPHLHFEVLRAQAAGQWWGGEAVNPYQALVAGRVDGDPARASMGGAGH